MGQLVWTYQNGVDFQSDSAGFRITVGRAPAGSGYRYAVLPRDMADAEVAPLASGSRESLREAIEAAEQAVGTIDPSLDFAAG